MKKVISILLGVIGFYGTAALLAWALLTLVTDISDPAPDALHIISFIALLPMIGLVGDRFASRKADYIKKSSYFKPTIIGVFIATYLSFIPWILTFFISDNRLLLYIDWSIVLLNICLSFVLFALFLYIFIRK